MPHRTQVIVVGAGPVGLLLAGELALAGVRVVLVEQLAEPTGESRASQLNARTMEILEVRGLLGRLDDPQPVSAGHFGGIGLSVADVPSRHPGFWKIPQFRTEAALQEWALELGVDLRRGHRLHRLVQHPDGVRAEVVDPAGRGTRLAASYLVGCDGEDSTVRELARIAFPGHDATRELLRGDVAGIAVPDRRFERHPRGLAIAARRPDGVTRVMVHEFGAPAAARSGPPEFAELAAAWRRVTGEDISAGRPLWTGAFGDADRQAAQYRRGRVLLAGDAAHRQMPAGGQALNLGLQDAHNLGWKLAATVAGWAPPDLLDSYHAERHPVGARVQANVAAQAVLLLGGPETDAARTLLGELLRIDDAAAHLAGAVSGLDVGYPADPADPDGTGAHPLVGHRLADLGELRTDHPSGATRTAELLRPGRPVLLELSTATDPDADATGGLADLLAGWSDRVDHVRVAPRTAPVPGVPGPDVDAVLLRPDGHVAWAGRAATGPGPGSALRRWFGPRTPDRAATTPATTPTPSDPAPRPPRPPRRRPPDPRRPQPVGATPHTRPHPGRPTGPNPADTPRGDPR